MVQSADGCRQRGGGKLSGEHDEHHHPSAWGPHHWDHGAPHNSWVPLVMSIGFGIFLFMLANAFNKDVVDASYIP